MRSKTAISAAVSALLLGVCCGTALAGTCRVTTAGTNTNNGSAWSEPMDLQTALKTAACTEIWVAAGTYKPTTDSNRTISFVVGAGVAVYGGFAGTESERAQRDLAANVTRLSGDIGTSGVATDNSYQVVIVNGTSALPVTASTVLDGFTISDSHYSSSGGGLYCHGSGAGNECSPTLSNLVFEHNYAYYGGGLYSDGSAGGVSSPHLSNVTFIDNWAINSGGAMYDDGYNGGNSSPLLDGVTFSGNTTDGGIGGALAHYYSGAPVLNNVTFSANGSNVGPNGVAQGNWNTIWGGAIAVRLGGNLTLSNVTFSGNSAPNDTGGAIYNNGGSVVVSNAIFWGDSAATGEPEFANVAGSATITSSVIHGGCPAGCTCVGVIDSDPLLGPLQDNGGPTQTLFPAAGSPAIDAGYNATCASTDQRGVPRPQGAACDMGAVEVVFQRIFADNFDGRPTP